MNRRAFLASVGAAIAAPAHAHTPYGQWVVYRQKHLLIGSHRGDLRTYELAQKVVAALDARLPTAKARVARGPRPQRIASLLSTQQIFLSVLSADEAIRMMRAEAPFNDNHPIPLTLLADLDADYCLVAAPEFHKGHALLVTRAVNLAGLGTPPRDIGIMVHPGAEMHWDA